MRRQRGGGEHVVNCRAAQKAMETLLNSLRNETRKLEEAMVVIYEAEADRNEFTRFMRGEFNSEFEERLDQLLSKTAYASNPEERVKKILSETLEVFEQAVAEQVDLCQASLNNMVLLRKHIGIDLSTRKYFGKADMMGSICYGSGGIANKPKKRSSLRWLAMGGWLYVMDKRAW
jgi:hypothetical protein